MSFPFSVTLSVRLKQHTWRPFLRLFSKAFLAGDEFLRQMVYLSLSHEEGFGTPWCLFWQMREMALISCVNETELATVVMTVTFLA
jgi:hypothetical protein